MGLEQGLSQEQLDFYQSEGGFVGFLTIVAGSGFRWSVLEANPCFLVRIWRGTLSFAR